jgi:Uma2 family endonuclease
MDASWRIAILRLPCDVLAVHPPACYNIFMSIASHSNDPFDVIDGKTMPSGPMTEDEFVAWCDEDIKAEWVDGRVIVMAAASLVHVRLTDFLSRLMGAFAEARGLGQVLSSEFQVRLPPDSRRRVPDVLFVAKDRMWNLQVFHLEGAPDLAVEVVSADSIERDWQEKYHEYQVAGVREYWIVDPLQRQVAAFALAGPRGYQPLREIRGKIVSGVLRGFYLKPQWLWRDELPRIEPVHREILRGR